MNGHGLGQCSGGWASSNTKYMTVNKLLGRIRLYYLNKFEEQIRWLEASRAESQIIIEPALLNENGEAVAEGFFDAPYRTDIVVIEDGSVTDSIMVDTEGMLGFHPVVFTWDEGLKVTLNPCQWNSIEVLFEKPPGEVQWQRLEEWFSKWFEETDFASGYFSGVVHYISDPEEMGKQVIITIDLGSAPVEALENLLDSLHLMQIKRVEIR